VVVTYNSAQWVERCLESVRDYETIVVDHGSTDGTVELVRRRFPEAHVIEEENLGMGGGNNAGMRLASGRYFLLLNSDAWLVGDGAEQLAGFADQHPDAAVVGPRLLNPDGSLQRSARAFPTLWRLATEYLFLRKLAPRSRLLNTFYEGGFDHDEVREVDWLFGACLLVRRDAADEVGLFDEDFFMFSEETDWCYRFRQAGWRVFFFPGAEAMHVGGASHGGGVRLGVMPDYQAESGLRVSAVLPGGPGAAAGLANGGRAPAASNGASGSSSALSGGAATNVPLPTSPRR